MACPNLSNKETINQLGEISKALRINTITEREISILKSGDEKAIKVLIGNSRLSDIDKIYKVFNLIDDNISINEAVIRVREQNPLLYGDITVEDLKAPALPKLPQTEDDILASFGIVKKTKKVYDILGNLIEERVINKKKSKVLKFKEFVENVDKNLDTQYQSKIDKLSNSFKKIGINVTVKLDETLTENANIEYIDSKNVILTLNPNKVFKDTIGHEFSHIYIDLLGVDHPIVKAALKQVKTKSPHIVKLVEDAYVDEDLTREELDKEILVTAMGFESSILFDDIVEESKWKAFINQIYRAVGKLFGKEPNYAKELFEDLLIEDFKTPIAANLIGKKKSKIEDLEAKSKRIVLLNNESYKNVDTGSLFKRATEFLSNKFSRGQKSVHEDFAEQAAKTIFSKNNKNINDTVELDLKDEGKVNYTFQQLKEYFLIKYETDRVYGNVVHLLFERIFKVYNKESVTDLDLDIREQRKGKPGKQKPIDWDLGWINQGKDFILNELGINIFSTKDEKDKDKVNPEFIVYSDILKVGSRIDLLVTHSNTDYSIIDFKSGRSFLIDSGRMDRMMKYSDSMYDTKLQHAVLEVAFRAMMIKEMQPDARFRNLTVAFVNKKNFVDKFTVDLSSSLDTIEKFIKLDSEFVKADGSNPTYDKMKSLGLFNSNNYGGMSEDYIDNANLPHDQQIKTILDELYALQTIKKPSSNQKKRIEELSLMIINLKKEYGDMKINLEGDDINPLISKIKNKYSNIHPAVQSFFNKMYDPAQKALKEHQYKLNKKHDELFKEVFKEYLAKKGLTYSNNLFVKYLNSAIIEYNDLFDFMWTESEDNRVLGKYRNTDTTKMTAAQKAYYEFFSTTIDGLYNKTMSRKVRNHSGKMVTLGEFLGRPETAPNNFMPRTFLNMNEVRERAKRLGESQTTEYITERFNRMKKSFIKDLVDDKNEYAGIPLKYMGSDKIIGEENHTLNTEVMFKSYINNMLAKEYYDDVISVGKGLATAFETESTSVNIKNFLLDQLSVLIENNQDGKIKKEELYKITLADGKVKAIDYGEIIDSSKGYWTSVVMWFKPISGTMNGMYGTILNIKDGLKGSLAKRLGVSDEDIDFTLSDLAFAEKEVVNYWKDLMAGNKENNKLFNLLERYGYLPDSFDYAINSNQLISGKNKFLDGSIPFMFHSIPEEYLQMMLFTAQLKHQKNKGTGKSIWESYNDKAEWIGGVRGKRILPDGKTVELTELTSEEIVKLERVSSRIQGGYRQNERVGLELTALGRWMLQFKKYLPSVIENVLTDKYNDPSLGKFTLVQGTDDVYTWQARVHEGRILVFGKLLMNWVKFRTDPNYKWENLDNESKQQVIEVANSLIFWMILFTITNMMFDDDDKDRNPWYWRMERMTQDMTQGYNPVDFLRSFQTQTVVLPKTYKVVDGFTKMMLDGVIMGQRIKTGPNKGNLPGSTQFFKGLPIFNSFNELEKYYESSNWMFDQKVQKAR